MKPTRKLVLVRETLTDLTAEQLAGVVGADLGTTDKVTVFFTGCATNPRQCHYVTDFC